MIVYHFIRYLYHRWMRYIFKRPGKWQTAEFERHHKRMKYHRDKWKG